MEAKKWLPPGPNAPIGGETKFGKGEAWGERSGLWVTPPQHLWVPAPCPRAGRRAPGQAGGVGPELGVPPSAPPAVAPSQDLEPHGDVSRTAPRGASAPLE